MPTQREMIEALTKGADLWPPLRIRVMALAAELGQNWRADALIEASWQGARAEFVVECKSISTPQAFSGAMNQVMSTPNEKGFWPMVFLPYLNEGQLMELEKKGISGIDLCGNCVVIAPGALAVLRSGGMNRFSSSASIKNIYRKNSSMVARTFLSRPSYESVQDVLEETNRRNMLVTRWNKNRMTLSTVSKSLKVLKEDLIVGRAGAIRLLQPDQLLEKLTRNYVPPKVKERIRLKVPGTNEALRQMLLSLSEELGIPIVASGFSSVGQYALMQRGDLLSVYCPRPAALMERLSGRPGDRFPNLEFVETEDETVYFDARPEGGFWWASPLQVYLELMSGDKRDRETAEQVRALILGKAGVA